MSFWNVLKYIAENLFPCDYKPLFLLIFSYISLFKIFRICHAINIENREICLGIYL